ncbi:MAG: hypothetical protein KY457_04615 [Actinobacteria bacterium]|nr:hypothetical protein [Actinomycetota bacterium]
MRTRVAALMLAGATVLAVACGGDGGVQDADTGFQPVRIGASGFGGGAPQPLAAGTLSVSKIADGATFFARVEDAGGTDLPEGENARFRLAGVDAPSPADEECLAGTSKTHLRGIVRGAHDVSFVLAEGAETDDPDGVPVHLWSRGLWVNGEVLARGYAELGDDTGDRRQHAAAAEEFAREREQGVWNPSLCDDGDDGAAGATEEGA